MVLAKKKECRFKCLCFWTSLHPSKDFIVDVGGVRGMRCFETCMKTCYGEDFLQRPGNTIGDRSFSYVK